MTGTRHRQTDRGADQTAAARKPVPGTIGALECCAGIDPDPDSRFAFWIRFRDSADPIREGVAELRRRIGNPAP